MQSVSHKSCILFHFYIKPQLLNINVGQANGCILFHFYIKPQLPSQYLLLSYVVSYSISTSNHNGKLLQIRTPVVVSYSISTSNHNSMAIMINNIQVVSYSISTSNHNPHGRMPGC